MRACRSIRYQLVCLVGAGIPLFSLAIAQPTAADARIRTIKYAGNSVVTLKGCTNFQTTVDFGPTERIENVGLGDSSQWQVMPNKRADLLFVKPLTQHAFSNMTVVTANRIFNFELRSAPASACRHGHVVYTLIFHYANQPAATSKTNSSANPKSLLPPAEKRNSAYTYSGDKTLVPFRVFDDGQSTYFMWAKGVSIPAVYAIGTDGRENLVNTTSRGDYVVVEQVARAFVLRLGERSAKLYNDAFVVPKLDALSPQPKKERDQGFWPF